MNTPNTRGPCLRRALAASALALMACMPEERPDDVAGSGTELGNVVGIIHTGDDKPAGGLEVTLYPLNGDSTRILRTETDGRGIFGFEAAPGAYRLLSLDGQGNGVSVDSIEARSDARVDLSRRYLAPLGGIAGRVRVAGSRGGAVELRLLGSPFTHRTPPDSAFAWDGIPAGRYWLQVYYPGAAAVEAPVLVETGKRTVLADTLKLVYAYSFGVSRRDTIVLSSGDIPFTARDRIFEPGVDRVSWVLNGTPYPVPEEDKLAPILFITRAMLRDSGSNLLELRIILPDTAVSRQWHIVIDDTRLRPWAYHAIRAVFLSKQPSPRPSKDYVDLGRFRILERRVLSEDELVFWEETQPPGADTAIPPEIDVPINTRWDAGSGCVGPACQKEPSIPFLPGDTLTFFLFPDTNFHGMAFRIRKDERFEDLAKLGWFARARWPLAEVFAGLPFERLSRLSPSLRPDGLHFRQAGHSGYAELPEIDHGASMLRRYLMDSTGGVREILAVPEGFASASLMLHYRDYREGIVSDTVPTRPEFVYIDSSGKGLASSDGVRRSFQLDAAELAELRGILSALPAPIPKAWEEDYYNNNPVGRHLDSTRYIFSDGRGTILKLPHGRYYPDGLPPQDKLQLVLRVDAWLREKKKL